MSSTTSFQFASAPSGAAIPNIFVISHRRSGTHLVIDTIRNNFPAVSDAFLTLECLYPQVKPHIPGPEFEKQLGRGGMIVKTHMDAQLETEPFAPLDEMKQLAARAAPRTKAIYIYRDGRDVLTSFYHYRAKIGPVPPSIHEFLQQKVSDWFPGNRIEYWVHHVSGWLGRSDVLYVSFEELIRSPESVVAKLAAWIGLPAPQKVANVDLNQAQANKGVRRSSVLPRKGKIGDFKQLFDEKTTADFNGMAGELMRELGYDGVGGRDDTANS